MFTGYHTSCFGAHLICFASAPIKIVSDPIYLVNSNVKVSKSYRNVSTVAITFFLSVYAFGVRFKIVA